MWAITKRVVPPIVLLLAGIGLLVYGLLCHRVSVAEDKEVTRKIKIPIPGLFGPGMPPEGLFPEDEAPPEEEEVSPFETPAEEESPFETPSEEESPFETPSEEEKSLMERFSLSEDSASEESLPGGLPFGDPGPFGGPPQFIEDTETEKIEVSREEPETVLIREVSRSGLMRLANGQLKRTYSGKPPDFCKT